MGFNITGDNKQSDESSGTIGEFFIGLGIVLLVLIGLAGIVSYSCGGPSGTDNTNSNTVVNTAR